jgi:hypothetical protein
MSINLHDWHSEVKFNIQDGVLFEVLDLLLVHVFVIFVAEAPTHDDVDGLWERKSFEG